MAVPLLQYRLIKRWWGYSVEYKVNFTVLGGLILKATVPKYRAKLVARRKGNGLIRCILEDEIIVGEIDYQ
ncbi:MAG: hypothetical protein BroJett018_51980 [Chloroflexota bacterium]|nr:hypothetical protein [Chloroflexota bacterium]GIK67404.1 MAG: hypothetical protein BroJett018_51980 [Chloroflexota bacterium]